MKLLYVIQGYGREVFGGAESLARMMATRMVARGHEMHVLTSCAKTYYDWANFYEPGTGNIDGVTVHRMAVDETRNHELFGPLSGRVLGGDYPSPLYLQERWIETQGPHLPELPKWIWDHALDYDAVIFSNYLYYQTVFGLPMASGRVPTVMFPLAHDEPPLYLPIFDSMFKLPTGMAYLVEEEAELVRKVFNPKVVSTIVGVGSDLGLKADGDAFRREYNLGDTPYLVSVGRLDPHKGSDELVDLFIAYKDRNPSNLKMVLVGEPVREVAKHDDIVVTGFVSEETRNNAVAGATASMHPSYFESFSMALTEAWVQSKPAIVNGRCEVFVGQARRSGGALPYKGFAEFEAAVDMVVTDAKTAALLGRRGRAYVEERYDWDNVLSGFEEFLSRVPSV